MTDVAFTGAFIRNTSGITFADSASVVFAFDPATNQLSATAAIGTPGIADNAVTNPKLADMVQATIKGRASGAGTGDPVDLTAAQVKTILALASTDISDFTEAAQDAALGVMGNTGRIAFTYNDVGNSLTADIVAASIGNSHLVTMAQSTIKGRAAGAGTGAPVDLSTAQVKTLLSLDLVENTALSTWGGSTNLVTVGTIGTGTWNATAIADGKIASALTGKTYNGLTLTSLATGFSVAGGTSSKTLTVPNTASVSGTNTGDQTGANPSASSGLTAVNGTALTFMTSDSAPALNQGIAPTWTGLHSWSQSLGAFSATGNPFMKLVNTSASAQTPVDFFSNTSTLTGRIRNDSAGNMSYVSLLSGNHDFFVGGDSGVGVLSFEIKSGKINLAGHATTTTAPAAGGAGALPATPTGYVTIQVNGVDRKQAYY